jgi:hypothetical protein
MLKHLSLINLMILFTLSICVSEIDFLSKSSLEYAIYAILAYTLFASIIISGTITLYDLFLKIKNKDESAEE